MTGGGDQTRCFTGDVQMANTKKTIHCFLTQLPKMQSCYVSCHFHCTVFYFPISKRTALAGNRTWASRVAGENSTTEPPVPC